MKQKPCAQNEDSPGGCVAEPLAFHDHGIGYGNPQWRHELPVEYRDRNPEQEPDDPEKDAYDVFWFHGGLLAIVS